MMFLGKLSNFFLQNCSLLECLVVHKSNELMSLEVSGQSLKLRHLEIHFCHALQFLKVSDTINLVSLVIQKVGELQIHNVPMLVEVSVSCYGSYEDFSTFSSPFFSCFSQLEVLMLNVCTLMMEEMESQVFPELTNLKQLGLEIWKDNKSIMGITLLMRACPILHKFVLKKRSNNKVYNVYIARGAVHGATPPTTSSPLWMTRVIPSYNVYIARGTKNFGGIFSSLDMMHPFTFDFVGKDSIRFVNEILVEPQVFDAIKGFCEGKEDMDLILGGIEADHVNVHLEHYMSGLTAKVFRTYLASLSLDQRVRCEFLTTFL
ncbi:hypothetical protein OROHE_019487 [Orobanche hederae]